MQKNDSLVLNTIIKIVLPYILLLVLYIQFSGEDSPGGGFQAGSVLASLIIGYTMINPYNNISKLLTLTLLTRLSASGILLCMSIGIVSLINGDHFMNYYSLLSGVKGQHLGIFILELGIGLTVSSSMLTIYYVFLSK